MVIVGIILLVASIILFFVRLSQLKKLNCIQSARLYSERLRVEQNKRVVLK